MNTTPDDLARRGYDAELRRHRENLGRALAEVRFVLDSLERQRGSAGLTSETRRLLAAAGDAAQAAAAVSAAEQLSFAFEQDS